MAHRLSVRCNGANLPPSFLKRKLLYRPLVTIHPKALPETYYQTSLPTHPTINLQLQKARLKMPRRRSRSPSMDSFDSDVPPSLEYDRGTVWSDSEASDVVLERLPSRERSHMEGGNYDDEGFDYVNGPRDGRFHERPPPRGRRLSRSPSAGPSTPRQRPHNDRRYDDEDSLSPSPINPSRSRPGYNAGGSIHSDISQRSCSSSRSPIRRRAPMSTAESPSRSHHRGYSGTPPGSPPPRRRRPRFVPGYAPRWTGPESERRPGFWPPSEQGHRNFSRTPSDSGTPEPENEPSRRRRRRRRH